MRGRHGAREPGTRLVCPSVLILSQPPGPPTGLAQARKDGSQNVQSARCQAHSAFTHTHTPSCVQPPAPQACVPTRTRHSHRTHMHTPTGHHLRSMLSAWPPGLVSQPGVKSPLSCTDPSPGLSSIPRSSWLPSVQVQHGRSPGPGALYS